MIENIPQHFNVSDVIIESKRKAYECSINTRKNWSLKRKVTHKNMSQVRQRVKH